MHEMLLSHVVAVAEEAGRAIMDIYTLEDFDTTYKEDDSPLTRADVAANDVIVAGLRKLNPGYPVLTEESKARPYEERKSWRTLWVVDPLDGTKEFIKRNGEFTVNIALVVDGSPVLGVVHAPALGVTYYAEKGLGAFKKASGGAPEKICAVDYHGQRLKVVASRSHITDEVKELVERIGEVEFVSMGSSLKLCLVAEGAAHLYPRLGPTMEWDTAAAQCVVESAGGHVTDMEGRPLVYNKEDLLNEYFIVTGDPPFPWEEYLGRNAG